MKALFKVLIVVFTFLIAGCSQYAEPQKFKTSPVPSPQGKLEGVQIAATYASIQENILERKCVSCHNPDSANKKAKDIPLRTEAEVLSGSSTSGDLVVAGNPNKSVLYQSVVKYDSIRKKVKVMPPTDSKHAALTGDETQAIAAWISSLEKPGDGVTGAPGDGGSGRDSSGGSIGGNPPGVSTGNCSTPAEALLVEPSILDYAFIKTQILDKKCVECHKAGGKAEELPFGSRDEVLSLTDMDAAKTRLILPNKAEESPFYLSILKNEGARKNYKFMPPRKVVNGGSIKDITVQEISLIKRWIADGAR